MIRFLPLSLWLGYWIVLANAHAEYSHHRYQRLGRAEGLVNPFVQAIVQDRQGFMWLGTEDGLYKYDGYSVRGFRPRTAEVYEVCSIIQDDQDTLWLATPNAGLHAFDTLTETFREFRHDPLSLTTISNDAIHCVCRTADGLLWLGTPRGLDCFNPATEDSAHFLTGEGVTAIYESRTETGLLWIGTQSNSVFRMDQESGEIERFRSLSGSDHKETGTVRAIYEEHEGNLWIGVDDPRNGGLYRFTKNNETILRLQHDPNQPSSLRSNRVTSIHGDPHGNLWVGTLGGGLNRMWLSKIVKREFLADPFVSDNRSSPSNPDVMCLAEDRGGLLWIGTRGGGADRLDLAPRWFHHYPWDLKEYGNLVFGRTLSQHQDGNFHVWTATTKGLIQWQSADEPLIYHTHDPEDDSSLPEAKMLDIRSAPSNALWIGTEEGLSCLATRTGQVTHLPNPTGAVRVLARSSKAGELLAGAATGLWSISETAVQPYQEALSEVLRDEGFPISSILSEKGGNLWVGTDGGGLHLLNRESGSFRRFRHDPRDPNSLGHDGVLSIHRNLDGILWIGTRQGLNRFDDAEQRMAARISQESGLRDDWVSEIRHDRSGDLWLGTRDGITLITAAASESPTFRFFQSINGVRLGQVTSTAHMANGTLMFGTNEGVWSLYPWELPAETPPPPMAFTGLKRFNYSTVHRSLPVDSRVVLSPQERVVTFQFSALDYLNPRNNAFMYRLDGFDDQWSPISQVPEATYTNLPPRDYVFRLRAANSNGIWNTRDVFLNVRVLPNWWQTRGFKGLVALCCLAMVGFAWWRVMQERRRQENSREALAHASRVSMVGGLSGAIAHEISQPLTAILSNAQAAKRDLANDPPVLDELPGIIDDIISDDQRAHEVIDHMRSMLRRDHTHYAPLNLNELVHSSIDFIRHDSRFRNVQFVVEPLSLDVPKVFGDRVQLEQVLLNLILNAADSYRKLEKASKSIEIELFATAKEAQVRVSDRGCGFEGDAEDLFMPFVTGKEDGLGIGLAISRSIVRAHGGDLSIVRNSRAGTSCLLRIPLY